jgi:hypothetical protein
VGSLFLICPRIIGTRTGTPVFEASTHNVTGTQPLDADLTAIAGLTPANDDLLQRKSGAWVNRTLSQLRSDLMTAVGRAVSQLATPAQRSFIRVDNDGSSSLITVAETQGELGLQSAAFQPTTAFDAAGSAAAAQAAAIAASQPVDADLTAIAGLSTNGLVERTGAGTAAIRAIGVAASTDVPTRADGDARYELASTTSRSGISSPFTTNSASLVDITGLNVTLQANSVYQFYAYIVCQSTNTSTGFGQTFSFTNSPTKIQMLVQQQRTTAAPVTTALNQLTASDEVVTQTTVNAANTDYFMLSRGVVVTGANASVVQARLVRGGSANNVSAQYGYIIAHKVS